MTREQSLIQKRIMIKSMLKNPEYPKELQETALEELRDTDTELEIIQGTPRNQKSAFAEDIGLKQPEQTIDRPIFLSPSRIKRRKRDMSKVMKSGITDIDKYIIGFNPQELSIWSGSNGSGKSTVLSQIAIEAINQGFKVALFSGELRDDRVLEWINLQCAGKKFTEGTQYANYFRVQNGVHEKINQWLEGKLFIYNNDYGNNVNKVLKAVMECIKANGVNMIIIDNMMSLDVASIGGEKYERQTSLVVTLCELAKQYNVHIHFVAHPRKAIGFLRKTDISGTADLTNAADNVFIVHRVNRDFKQSTKTDLGFKDDNILYQFSNVVEICKNRDLGIQDAFVGTVFEPESKRFKNNSMETKRYGWEKDENGFMDIDEQLPLDE